MLSIVVVLEKRVVAPVLCAAEPPSLQRPQWIWTSENRTPGQSIILKREFELDQLPQKAVLRVAGDFCHVTVRLDDEVVLSVEDFSQITSIEVTPLLRGGVNCITIAAIPTAGPSALAFGLDMTQADGTRIRLASDETWQSDSAGGTVSLGEVAPELWGEAARPIVISPFDNYE